jgi:hypothetical protein
MITHTHTHRDVQATSPYIHEWMKTLEMVTKPEVSSMGFWITWLWLSYLLLFILHAHLKETLGYENS